MEKTGALGLLSVLSTLPAGKDCPEGGGLSPNPSWPDCPRPESPSTATGASQPSKNAPPCMPPTNNCCVSGIQQSEKTLAGRRANAMAWAGSGAGAGPGAGGGSGAGGVAASGMGVSIPPSAHEATRPSPQPDKTALSRGAEESAKMAARCPVKVCKRLILMGTALKIVLNGGSGIYRVASNPHLWHTPKKG